MGILNRIKNFFSYSDFKIVRDVAIVKPWENSEYTELFEKSCRRISKERAFVLLEFLESVLELDGDIVEMGVYKGSTAYMLAKRGKGKKLHLFDTFEGTPQMDESYENDSGLRAGQYADTSLEGVKRFLGGFRNEIFFYPGRIPDTFSLLKEKDRWCFVHIHLNLYESTREALEEVYKRTRGGVAVVEDYGLKSCKGVKKAVDEFCERKHVRFVYLPTGQGVILL